jgi:hypothetical protein
MPDLQCTNEALSEDSHGKGQRSKRAEPAIMARRIEHSCVGGCCAVWSCVSWAAYVVLSCTRHAWVCFGGCLLWQFTCTSGTVDPRRRAAPGAQTCMFQQWTPRVIAWLWYRCMGMFCRTLAHRVAVTVAAWWWHWPTPPTIGVPGCCCLCFPCLGAYMGTGLCWAMPVGVSVAFTVRDWWKWWKWLSVVGRWFRQHLNSHRNRG